MPAINVLAVFGQQRRTHSPDQVIRHFELLVELVVLVAAVGRLRACVVQHDHRGIARVDLVGGRAGDEFMALVMADDHQRALGQLCALRVVDQQALDPAVVIEGVGDLAVALELVGLDDLADLRAGFIGAGLGVAFGGQGAVAFGTFGLQLPGVDLRCVGRRHRLAVPLPGLLTDDLRGLALLDQAGLQQLILQGIAHCGSLAAGRRGGCVASRIGVPLPQGSLDRIDAAGGGVGVELGEGVAFAVDHVHHLGRGLGLGAGVGGEDRADLVLADQRVRHRGPTGLEERAMVARRVLLAGGQVQSGGVGGGLAGSRQPMRRVGGHHPQGVAPAEHVEVDVLRGGRAALGDVGVGAEQAALLLVPERDADAVVGERLLFEALGQRQNDGAAGRIVGRALALADAVGMGAQQQQRGGCVAADLGDQVLPGAVFAFERNGGPRQSEGLQLLLDGVAATGVVVGGGDRFDIGQPGFRGVAGGCGRGGFDGGGCVVGGRLHAAAEQCERDGEGKVVVNAHVRIPGIDQGSVPDATGRVHVPSVAPHGARA